MVVVVVVVVAVVVAGAVVVYSLKLPLLTYSVVNYNYDSTSIQLSFDGRSTEVI